LKLKIHPIAAAVSLVLVFGLGLLSPGPASGQGAFFMFGPGATFDWSDFRAGATGRVFFGRLASLSLSGTLPSGTVELDLRHLLKNDMQITRDVGMVLWINRLGLRGSAEERQFTGRNSSGINNANDAIPELDLGTSRLGIDLDLVRYPFAKLGFNLDVGAKEFTLRDWRDFDGSGPLLPARTFYRSELPITIGFHVAAIPCRLREVPVYVQARGRFPVPYLQQVIQMIDKGSKLGEVHVVDWEVSGGLRPAVWETSSFGHSTYSLSIEAGFRSVTLDSPLRLMTQQLVPVTVPSQIDLRAHWQGAFFQIVAFF
jgi:hypothetical protein